MSRNLLTLLLVLGMSAAAGADVITDVPLAFDTPSGSTNRMTLELWAGGTVDTGFPFGNVYVEGSDTETTNVSGNMIVDLECTFNETTHAMETLTGMNFTGGIFSFSPVNFDLNIQYGGWLSVGHVYANGTGVGGSFDTINEFPPANVTGNQYFDMEDHEVVVNQGTLQITADGIVGDYVDPMTYNLAVPGNEINASTTGTGTLTVAFNSMNGLDAIYDVHISMPLNIDETIYDEGGISATLSTTQTSTYAATGQFTVTPSNHPPVANDDPATEHATLYQANEDNMISVAAGAGVLYNDTDADLDDLDAYKISNPAYGSVALNTADGAFEYTPNPDWHGSDSFTYQAYDGTDWSNTATVDLEILPVNDPPVAEDDEYECDQNGSVTTHGYDGVLANDTDVDNDHSELDAGELSDPEHGSITGWGTNGWFTYESDAGWFGDDTFTYKAYDGTDWSTEGTVTIHVLGSIPGDATGEGIVDKDDAAIVAQYWGQSVSGSSEGDFDGDGIVGPADAAILASNWGYGTEAAGAEAVPEPSTLVLLLGALTGLALLRQTR